MKIRLILAGWLLAGVATLLVLTPGRTLTHAQTQAQAQPEEANLAARRRHNSGADSPTRVPR